MLLTGFLGLFLGCLVATIGAWKDSRWEPFRWGTFWRSPIVTCLVALLLATKFPNQPKLLLGLAAVALERLLVETWKGCLRQKPSKFVQPERDTRWLRQQLSALSRHRQVRQTLVIAIVCGYVVLYGVDEYQQLVNEGVTAGTWAYIWYCLWCALVFIPLGGLGLMAGLLLRHRGLIRCSAFMTALPTYALTLAVVLTSKFSIPLASIFSIRLPTAQ
ncbi:MAG: hypothetical protein HYY50_02150 [Candidatus Kerfeldbacteria bacterium]|nr:hypothetical protein [Candidatus Kerfeldbacteria bacterium]